MTIIARAWCLGWLAALPLALAACGGGGGGGGSEIGSSAAVTEFQGKLSDVSAPVTVAPRYAHMQFEGVESIEGFPPGVGGNSPPTRSGGPIPPGGLLLEIDPVAGIVGINRTVYDNWTPQDFSIDFDDDSQAFAVDHINYNVYQTQRAKMLVPGAASGYDYTSYGVWNRANTFCLGLCESSFFADVFYFGSPTSSSQMPSSGQAIFNGTMEGFYSLSPTAVSLSGDATLAVNFGARTLIGSFHDISTGRVGGNLPTGDVSGFNDIFINAQISGGSLSGTVTGGAGGSGTIEGDFFGPAASEVGGVFRMTGAGDTVGAFAAKQ
jgi:hypothetical protein